MGIRRLGIMDIAAIYCRLSKEDADKLRKGDDSESIQNQKLLLMDYAMEHNMQIYKVYSDDDYSGADKYRPEWNRMLMDAEKGKFNVVICKTQSRFTRELEMVEKYIHGLFLEWSIRFIGVVDNVDTNIKGNKKSRQINGLVNEWYIEDLSNNIKSVFRKKMKDGQFLGAFSPYGYIKDPNDRHRIIVDAEAAKTVQKIYSLYIEGYSIKRICYILTEAMIPTPTVYKHSKGYAYKNPNCNSVSYKYGIWSPTTVRNILTNTTYLGILTQGKEKKPSYKSKRIIRAPESEWIVIENNHEAIIDKDTFYHVQKMLRVKRTVSGDAKGNNKTKAHCLAGKVKCITCGSSLIKTGGGSSQVSRYLRCQLANKTRNKMCTPHAVRLSQLQELVADEIHKIINEVLKEKNEEYFQAHLTRVIDVNSTIEEKTNEQYYINRIIQDNENALASLYMDKVKMIITEEEYIAYRERFRSLIQEHIYKKQELQKEIDILKADRIETSDTLVLIKKYMDFDELTNEITAIFIDYIEIDEKDVYGNQNVHIHWNV